MIKEIIQFTTSVLQDAFLCSYGVTPKEGLHIVLQVEKTLGRITIAEKPVFASLYNSKTEVGEWLYHCTDWWKASTMLGRVDTFKVFDVPAKAIHTVSPFCFGVKRTNLEGGDQYIENQKTEKSQVYERINKYFEKASALLDMAEDKAIAEAFQKAINDRTQFHNWLESCELFHKVKDGEYIVIYLNLPLEQYNRASHKYLQEKLFNTSEYNIPDTRDPQLLHGTSNWLNSFPTKKPFLMHQSATFDIAGRLTSKEAQILQEFAEMNGRKPKLFPNPLPLFIMADERNRALKIIKEDVVTGKEIRKSYLDTIEELQKGHENEVGNYYLLFLLGGEICDFDYVSQFKFTLNEDNSPWLVQDLFYVGRDMILTSVIDFQTQVLPPMFNNALVVRRAEKDWIFHWFDDFEPAYCKTPNAFLLAMKYRKAFYDFIYKSKRQGVTGNAIREILMTGILDDIRLDTCKSIPGSSKPFNTESTHIRTKLNLLFSLHQYFSKDSNSIFMASKIEAYRQKVDEIAESKGKLESDYEFAFAAGQVIDRIFFVSESSDRSFNYLEPFLAQSTETGFKRCIFQFFKRYKHGHFSKRFQQVFDDVMAYEVEGNFKDLMPLLLAGVFSPNLLFKNAGEANTSETISETADADN